MISKSRSYRIAIGLFTAILLMSLSGTVLADKSLCTCCSDMTEPSHMQSQPSSNCCAPTTCDHCAIGNAQIPTPVAAISDPGNTNRHNVDPLFTAQTITASALLPFWENAPKNNTPLEIHAKIPLYLHLQMIRC